MLLAVEGGGFFSSSASGYSSSLTLLLLGQKSEDNPMRVLPLLVDREPDLNVQLASTKTWISWRCASPSIRRCFRQNPAGQTTPSPLKKPATTRQDSLRTSPLSDNGKNHVPSADEDNLAKKMVLKSSLKKAADATTVSVGNTDGNEASGAKGSCESHVERRKVQWTDTCGSQLAEVKEFEPSEINASDDENDIGKRRCLCSIM